jgi:hypothetical protein
MGGLLAVANIPATRRLMRALPASTGLVAGEASGPSGLMDRQGLRRITLRPTVKPRKGAAHGRGVHTAWPVLIDQRPEAGEGDGVIVVGRFKGDPYDGVQLSYEAGRRNLYLTPEGALRLAFLLAAAVERDIDIR